MSLTETLILVLYFFVLSILAIYGWHRYYLVYLYMKHKGNVPPPLPPPTVLPRVTVQLPIFNEMYVADRLIDAVCEIDYPARAARDPGPGRLDRRDDARSPSSRCAGMRRAASTSSTCTASTARATRRARSKPA